MSRFLGVFAQFTRKREAAGLWLDNGAGCSRILLWEDMNMNIGLFFAIFFILLLILVVLVLRHKKSRQQTAEEWGEYQERRRMEETNFWYFFRDHD